MATEHIKIFTGTSIIVRGLQNRLDNSNINSLIKDPVNSGQLAGFGALGNSIELFILESDVKKAQLIVDTYKEEINL
ncbi:putative signal transducing protein [Polaribacter sp. L3A8]|uniref:putative signal transducing protein n=1 Tax=Polaribacter sp. L3A8 TaxID=2686361 RepID=UPI00131AAF4C|nr:DUF2007 domain-containing protein [Polaribacter sp. L3A8]